MIVVIHQPHFLPWAGYFNKLASADCLVLLDDAQYRKNYFQNRTLIRDPTGTQCKWLTIPVHARLKTQLQDVAIADPHWRQRVLDKLRGAYRKAPYFCPYFEALQQLFNECADLLVDVNFRTLTFILETLNFDLTILRSSQVDPSLSDNRLLTLCERVGATGYINGEGWGKFNNDISRIRNSGIKVYQQSFHEPYRTFSNSYYPACFNLSILDLLFYLGPSAAAQLLKSIWTLGERR